MKQSEISPFYMFILIFLGHILDARHEEDINCNFRKESHLHLLTILGHFVERKFNIVLFKTML